MTTDIDNSERDYPTGATNLKAYLAEYWKLDRNLPLHVVATSSDCSSHRWLAFIPHGNGSCEVIEAFFVITPNRGYWIRRGVKSVTEAEARTEWTTAATHGEWHGTV